MNVAVIGAGMAGLACSQALKRAGWQVTVFEKSRGPSGRVSTRQGADWQCDHGAQYFTVSTPAFAAQVHVWLQAGLVAEWHGRIAETDGLILEEKRAQPSRYVGVPKNTSPARQMAAGLLMHLEYTIDHIERRQGQWYLSSKEHGAYPQAFDQLILAIPAPQAHALLAPQQLPFHALAGSVPMRGCWALMARYPHILNLPYDGLFVNAGPLRWLARDSSKPGRLPINGPVKEVWLLHASPEWSEANIEQEPEQVAEVLFQQFVALGGATTQAYSIHRWRYADCAEHLQQGFAWDSSQQLGLCGDWLNGGKVEGAWMSGYLLAQSLRPAPANAEGLLASGVAG